MEDYNLEEVLQDLEELKKNTNEHPEMYKEIISEFKKKYPYTSEESVLIDLLNRDDTNIELIAKLLIMECKRERFSDDFYKRLRFSFIF